MFIGNFTAREKQIDKKRSVDLLRITNVFVVVMVAMVALTMRVDVITFEILDWLDQLELRHCNVLVFAHWVATVPRQTHFLCRVTV